MAENLFKNRDLWETNETLNCGGNKSRIVENGDL
jgi:hypothetical protein